MNHSQFLTCLFTGLLTFHLSNLLAQPAVVAKDESAVMWKVAPDVYCIIHDNATDEWPHGNSGVIVGEHGVMVVDANYLPSRAEADIALIRTITSKPIKFLVYTHWHFDHNNGGIAYRNAFPEIQIISERNTREYIRLNGLWWSRMNTAPLSPKRKSLGEKEKSLASGKGNSGLALTPKEKQDLKNVIDGRKKELAELSDLTVVVPNVVFDSELTLDLGGRQVVLRDWGTANSPNDVTVYLPTEQVLFTGDLVVQSPLPYTLNSHPVPWVHVLRQVESIPAHIVVPGHGPVMTDHSYAKQVREFFEATASRVKDLIEQGKSLQQIQEIITMEEYYVGVWNTGTQEGKDDWKVTVNMLVERTWRNLKGQ